MVLLGASTMSVAHGTEKSTGSPWDEESGSSSWHNMASVA